MAKKSTSTSETAKKSNDVQIDDEGFLCIRGELFWKWRALDAEYQASLASIKIKAQEYDAAVKSNPVIMAIRGDHESLQKKGQQVFIERQRFQTTLAEALGRPIAEIGVDDETGRVFDGSSPVAVSTPDKKHKKSGSAVTPPPAKSAKTRRVAAKR